MLNGGGCNGIVCVISVYIFLFSLRAYYLKIYV